MKRLLCSLLLLAGAVAAARAQTLADPTQPPPESRLLPQSQSDLPAMPRGPQLQSVLIGSHGREVAVIDGQTVRKGEKFNGAVLMEVRKNQVVLQKGRDKQVLTLFPDPAHK
ncbi:MSHA biogenesis protein MshK [Duganella sp. FT135W]|uniref:MSHA biogenesis protein MshK n=2 Tax=Duganella flavida TaxID=2692175 RepID=A0A6L8KK00_9BURK|nr:MSHA biogenesis protein MshK [Duganella flavida]